MRRAGGWERKEVPNKAVDVLHIAQRYVENPNLTTSQISPSLIPEPENFP